MGAVSNLNPKPRVLQLVRKRIHLSIPCATDRMFGFGVVGDLNFASYGGFASCMGLGFRASGLQKQLHDMYNVCLVVSMKKGAQKNPQGL